MGRKPPVEFAEQIRSQFATMNFGDPVLRVLAQPALSDFAIWVRVRASRPFDSPN